MAMWEITLTQTLYGQVMQNVLHFNGFETSLDPAAIALDIRDNWIAQVKTRQIPQLTYVNIKVQQVPITISGYNLPVNIAGTTASDSSTSVPFVSAVLLKQTNVAGRHGRGRVYIAGINSVTYVAGVFNSTAVTNWATVTSALMSRFGPSGSSDLTLWLYQSGESGADYEVQSLTLRTILGVQRRRNIGVGI